MPSVRISSYRCTREIWREFLPIFECLTNFLQHSKKLQTSLNARHRKQMFFLLFTNTPSSIWLKENILSQTDS